MLYLWFVGVLYRKLLSALDHLLRMSFDGLGMAVVGGGGLIFN